MVAAVASACGEDSTSLRTPALSAYRIGEGTKNEILVREVERGEVTAVVEVFVHRFGGALGGSMFKMACLADMAKQRGKTHFVVLSQEMIRRGTPSEPGNDGRMVVGFCSGTTPGDLGVFGAAADSIDPNTVFSVEQAAEWFPTIEPYRVSDE